MRNYEPWLLEQCQGARNLYYGPRVSDTVGPRAVTLVIRAEHTDMLDLRCETLEVELSPSIAAGRQGLQNLFKYLHCRYLKPKAISPQSECLQPWYWVPKTWSNRPSNSQDLELLISVIDSQALGLGQ
jgi:hypothetical protein